MKDDVKIILNSIVKEANIFLSNDMSLEVLDIKFIEAKLDSFTSCIELKNKHVNYCILLSVENTLLEKILYKFFKFGIEDDEKDELLDALPDEITNTIVGLAIKNFPSQFQDLELGIAYKITKDKMINIDQQTNFKSVKINTISGSLQYCVMKN